jgi:hypothetical protein
VRIRGGTVLCFQQARKAQTSVHFVYILHCLGKGCRSDSGHNLEANVTIRGGTVLCLEQSRKHSKVCILSILLHCLGKGCWSDSGHNLKLM